MLRTTQNVTISSRIPGIYTPGDLNKAIVIIAHGIMGCKNEYLNTSARISEKLEEKGVGSLRIDFRGHGDSNRSLAEFSLLSQLEDLRLSIEWGIKKGYSRVILVGISFGAPPCIIISEILRDIVEKCVLISPVIDYKKTFVYPETAWGKENFGYERLLKSFKSGLTLADDYILFSKVLMDILLVDIPSFVKQSSAPILIFHGDCDNMVPLATSVSISNDNDNVSLCVMPDTEHGLTEEGDETFRASRSLTNLGNIIKGILQK